MPVNRLACKWLLVLLAAVAIAVLLPGMVFAQEGDAKSDSLWISPGVEAAGYGISGSAAGGGLAVAYGGRVSVGIKAAYFVDLARVSNLEGKADCLEFSVLLRFFFVNAQSGPFVQLAGGPAFSFRLDSETSPNPESTSDISAGISLGWRFLLGKTVFVEPSVRGGYPFIAGAGICAGLRF
jgi:hypothetical protein